MPTSPESARDLSDPQYREAVIDLLGAMAYGELQAFERLAGDAPMGPDFYNRAAMAEMACAEFGHFKMLRARLLELGADPDVAMRPFVEAIDSFHASTAPNDWLESLVKAYVGDGIATDFYRDVAQWLDPATRDLINEVCADLGHSKFVVDAVQYCVAEDPKVAGRLALWGRRLMGEAVAQSQRVAAQREALIDLVLGGSGPDLAAATRMFADLTEAHTARMKSLGLEA